MTRHRSIKASVEEWALWAQAAELSGLSLHAFLRASASECAEAVVAAHNRRLDEVAKRAAMRAAIRG